jgi:hypothetical protein
MQGRISVKANATALCVGCGGLQCTEAARPAVSIQVASHPSYSTNSSLPRSDWPIGSALY